ncbi:MAG: chemotaxis protein CheZ [Kiritimatiellia bacterium]|jgi:chemotaxis protein CheZ
MESQLSTQSPPDMIEELRQCASVLTEKLQGDKYEEASKLIENIVECRDQHIFQSIGKLTRGLHDAIVNLNLDGGTSTLDNANTEDCEFNDASNRLNYVIELTQNAAEKTMDMVEEAAPISTNLANEAASLKQEWSRLRQREMTADEFRDLYVRVDNFFSTVDTSTTKLNENLQNIILEQGFQDLTGQVLKRVISLVSEVEGNLVSLVRIAGQVETIVGIKPKEVKEQTVKGVDIKGDGPQVKAEQREDVVNGQDEVDDLLSSLGF